MSGAKPEIIARLNGQFVRRWLQNELNKELSMNFRRSDFLLLPQPSLKSQVQLHRTVAAKNIHKCDHKITGRLRTQYFTALVRLPEILMDSIKVEVLQDWQQRLLSSPEGNRYEA